MSAQTVTISSLLMNDDEATLRLHGCRHVQALVWRVGRSFMSLSLSCAWCGTTPWRSQSACHKRVTGGCGHVSAWLDI